MTRLVKETKENLINPALSKITKGTSNKMTSTKIQKLFHRWKGTIVDKNCWSLRTRFIPLNSNENFMKIMRNQIIPSSGDKTPDYDWQKMTDPVCGRGQKKTDNNDYTVVDNYYNTYLKDRYASLKDSNKDLSYLESPGYSDMELFLTVARGIGH